MKKHLIAAAVAAAVAVPAMAQNVSVYGVISTGVESYEAGTAGSFTRQAKNLVSTSRLGFRGTEDLGGGLKAEFNLESSFDPVNGAFGKPANAKDVVSGTGAETSVSSFDREAWVGLSGGFGAIRLGKTDVTSAQAIDSFGGVAGNVTDFYSAGSDFANLGVDNDAVVRYTSPTMSGFSAQVGYANANKNGTTAVTTGDVQSLYGQYVAGPLSLALGYTTQDGATADRKVTNLGGKYNLGVATIGAYYSKGDEGTTEEKQTAIGALVPLSNGFGLHAQYLNYEIKSGGTTQDADRVVLAASKALSKRTSLYAAYAKVDHDDNTRDTRVINLSLEHAF